jgi:hypothetical protein
MKGWDEGAIIARSREPVLPRSVGMSIAAVGALLCWAGVIGIIQAL